MLIIQFPYIGNFENLTQKSFCFFFNRKTNFVRKQTFFEIFFCMQNLLFCVHNVVLDTIKLAVFVTCVRLQTQPRTFQKLNLERKNQNFLFMGKHLSYNFHIWKNAYHRVFIQFSVRMELYEIV